MAATLFNPLKSLVRPLVDYALPHRCPACGVVTGEQHRFCLSCWSELEFLGDPCCVQCGVGFEYAPLEGARCGACLADPPPLDRIRAAVAYGPIARDIALRLKYGRKVGLAALIATQLARHLPDRDDRLLVPVPLHRWRLWGRGFNQSALIARALGQAQDIPFDLESLVRVKRTPPLRGMGAGQRQRAVRGAFAIAPDRRGAITGKAVILIDDVHTSGATAAACAQVLRRTGAGSVDLLCWARVVGGRDQSNRLND